MRVITGRPQQTETSTRAMASSSSTLDRGRSQLDIKTHARGTR